MALDEKAVELIEERWRLLPHFRETSAYPQCGLFGREIERV